MSISNNCFLYVNLTGSEDVSSSLHLCRRMCRITILSREKAIWWPTVVQSLKSRSRKVKLEPRHNKCMVWWLVLVNYHRHWKRSRWSSRITELLVLTLEEKVTIPNLAVVGRPSKAALSELCTKSMKSSEQLTSTRARHIGCTSALMALLCPSDSIALAFPWAFTGQRNIIRTDNTYFLIQHNLNVASQFLL